MNWHALRGVEPANRRQTAPEKRRTIMDAWAVYCHHSLSSASPCRAPRRGIYRACWKGDMGLAGVNRIR